MIEKMWDLQEKMNKDPEYQALSAKREDMNLRFLTALENIEKEQEAAVLDYLGYILEMHYKILEYLIQ